jgi:uncharacterized paraquat-inducible protein A
MRPRRRERDGTGASGPSSEETTCPHCGLRSADPADRMVDPTTGRALCVRCGTELGKDPR